MRAFISSEMEAAADGARRAAARRAILGLGHTPVGFEDLPARAFRSGPGAVEACLQLVRTCHATVVIVDNRVTAPMRAEIDESRKVLGGDRIFYYFTRGTSRHTSASSLWASERENAKLATFDSPDELARHIGVSIASFINDALLPQDHPGRDVGLLPTTMTAGQFHYWKIPATKGRRIVATLTGNDLFYAALVNAALFAKLYNDRRSGALQTGKDKRAHYLEMDVDVSGNFYLVLRASVLLIGTVTVTPDVNIY